jgi:hypothetical protein
MIPFCFIYIRYMLSYEVWGIQNSRTSSCNLNQEEFEDIKGVITIRIPKKNRQRNGQKKKDKRTNNDLQNIHIKLKIE